MLFMVCLRFAGLPNFSTNWAAADKKLSGAAKISFTNMCVKDETGT
jgi:hypothetical protein